MALYDYRIAATWNVALNSLTNVESLVPSNSRRFYAPVSEGLYDPGQYKIRGDGTIFLEGYPETVWRFDALHHLQYFYLRDTILSGAYAGKVTIYTRLATTTYSRMNAVMILPKPSELQWKPSGFPDVSIRMTRLAASS